MAAIFKDATNAAAAPKAGSNLSNDVQPGVLNLESKDETPHKVKQVGSHRPKSPSKPLFREEQRGVWTLYYPMSNIWKTQFPVLGFQWNVLAIGSTIKVWWQFIGEVFSLGPTVVTLYFIACAVSGVFPSFKLKSESELLGLAERALSGQTQRIVAITELQQIAVEFLIIRILGWTIGALKGYSSSVVEQRVSLHFEKRLISVQSRLELGPSRDSDIRSRIKRVTGYSSHAWSTLSVFVDIIAAVGEVMALVSILKNQLQSPENSTLFGLWSFVYPLLSELRGLNKDKVFFAKITNHNWLRMQAFSQIAGWDRYKKEILSSGLEDYINNAYDRALSNLGDLSTRNPACSFESRWFGFNHIEELLDSLPLLFYTWSAVHDPSRFSLAAMVRMQQTSSAVRSAIWSLVFKLKDVFNLANGISVLYEVFALTSGIEDGHLSYPDDACVKQKGMSIEFKDVSFGYPSAPIKVLKNLSFKIEPGQLCVIVGENGCGKSTTINLLNRLYDCDSGEIHIDNHPIREYKVSTLRAAVNIMYQSYVYFPLAIKENLLMGCTNISAISADANAESAAKLGGAYDFIQKLPLGFETNLEPVTSGWASFDCGEDDRRKFKYLEKDDKRIDLSSGQWQRLAVSRSFMKNSETTRLLCYDEPRQKRRLRKLRGEKTMIFVTHRFGHLTKHADLIIYIGDGSVIEQGTHKSLLAQGGEYAKMY